MPVVRLSDRTTSLYTAEASLRRTHRAPSSSQHQTYRRAYRKKKGHRSPIAGDDARRCGGEFCVFLMGMRENSEFHPPPTHISNGRRWMLKRLITQKVPETGTRMEFGKKNFRSYLYLRSRTDRGSSRFGNSLEGVAGDPSNRPRGGRLKRARPRGE